MGGSVVILYLEHQGGGLDLHVDQTSGGGGCVEVKPLHVQA